MNAKEKLAFDALVEENKALQSAIAELEASHEKALVNADQSLKDQLTDKSSMAVALQTIVDEQAAKLSELQSSIDSVSATNAEERVLAEVDGKAYYFAKKSFRICGDPNKHTAESAKDNQTVLASILSIPDQKILLPV